MSLFNLNVVSNRPLPTTETRHNRLSSERGTEVDALKLLQAETAAELDSLLPAILGRAFEGKL